MKKIKAILMTLFVCTLGYGGYTAYDYITMSDAERFLLQNIDALTSGEDEIGLKGNCNKSYVIKTECRFVCGCGHVWYPSPRVEKAYASNITGQCLGCGRYPR